MKKTISVILAVLMIFSAFSVAAFAEDEAVDVFYTIKFVDYDGKEIKSLVVREGDIVPAPVSPTRENTEDIEYVFEGWALVEGDTVSELVFKPGTIPVATDDAVYMAIYSEHEHIEVVTFWNFIASIFARINQIFEYFYNLFTRNLS